ncbi:MAG: SDR family oxidoreductase [Endozoicomonas sp.]
MLLKDKVVIVSGIGPGLGVKLALIAAQEGAKAVVLSARTQSKLDDAEERIAALGTGCQTLKVSTDICDRAQCDNLVEQTLKSFGRVDALINSAYYHGNFEPIENADLVEWQKVYQTNVVGSMNMTQAVIPAMKEQGSGAIVMINTQAVRKPAVLDAGGESGYAASKAALGVSTKYLAEELGKYGIRVNSAYMGWMWGDPVEGYMQYVESEQNIPVNDQKAAVAQNIALGHIPTDDNCAKAALFLASDYAVAVTGASLDVNGGEFMPA